MNKTFAAALLCASAFAIKMKIRESNADTQEHFDIHEETWGDVCDYIAEGYTIDWDVYYDEVDVDADGIVTMEEFLEGFHDMEGAEAEFYANHSEYVYSVLSAFDFAEGLTKEELH